MSFDLQLLNGDLQISPSGSLSFVQNDDKLRQDLLKIILSPLGSNKAFPWYGSPISSQVIGKAFDKKIFKMEATNALIYAINNLMKLQKDQEKRGQYISPTESISQILDITVEQSALDPRITNITVSVSTRRGNIVSEAFTLAA